MSVFYFSVSLPLYPLPESQRWQCCGCEQRLHPLFAAHSAAHYLTGKSRIRPPKSDLPLLPMRRRLMSRGFEKAMSSHGRTQTDEQSPDPCFECGRRGHEDTAEPDQCRECLLTPSKSNANATDSAEANRDKCATEHVDSRSYRKLGYTVLGNNT